ncbi:hypothetical protein LshimejAT787_1200100 [Lyophyllum shimeji]|uniref:Uncharacterized protein n=1 Tax=Lyophyllum shimeji TaxID=47721 RepID=A0A9P3PVS1_LYOSH|nr:hypothetical protein LshimejAT787_1200100 [Lyophyllum shimeji]
MLVGSSGLSSESHTVVEARLRSSTESRLLPSCIPRSCDMDHNLRVLYRVVGEAFLLNFTRVATVTFLYGVFVLLFVVSTSLFLERGLVSRPTKAMFGASIVSFLLTSASWGADIAFLVFPIREFVREGLPEFSTLAGARTGEEAKLAS